MSEWTPEELKALMAKIGGVNPGKATLGPTFTAGATLSDVLASKRGDSTRFVTGSPGKRIANDPYYPSALDSADEVGSIEDGGFASGADPGVPFLRARGTMLSTPAPDQAAALPDTAAGPAARPWAQRQADLALPDSIKAAPLPSGSMAPRPDTMEVQTDGVDPKVKDRWYKSVANVAKYIGKSLVSDAKQPRELLNSFNQGVIGAVGNTIASAGGAMMQANETAKDAQERWGGPNLADPVTRLGAVVGKPVAHFGQNITNWANYLYSAKDPGVGDMLANTGGFMALSMLTGMGVQGGMVRAGIIPAGAGGLIMSARRLQAFTGATSAAVMESMAEQGDYMVELMNENPDMAPEDAWEESKGIFFKQVLPNTLLGLPLWNPGRRALGVAVEAVAESFQEGGQHIISQTERGRPLNEVIYDQELYWSMGMGFFIGAAAKQIMGHRGGQELTLAELLGVIRADDFGSMDMSEMGDPTSGGFKGGPSGGSTFAMPGGKSPNAMRMAQIAQLIPVTDDPGLAALYDMMLEEARKPNAPTEFAEMAEFIREVQTSRENRRKADEYQDANPDRGQTRPKRKASDYTDAGEYIPEMGGERPSSPAAGPAGPAPTTAAPSATGLEEANQRVVDLVNLIDQARVNGEDTRSLEKELNSAHQELVQMEQAQGQPAAPIAAPTPETGPVSGPGAATGDASPPAQVGAPAQSKPRSKAQKLREAQQAKVKAREQKRSEASAAAWAAEQAEAKRIADARTKAGKFRDSQFVPAGADPSNYLTFEKADAIARQRKKPMLNTLPLQVFLLPDGTPVVRKADHAAHMTPNRIKKAAEKATKMGEAARAANAAQAPQAPAAPVAAPAITPAPAPAPVKKLKAAAKAKAAPAEAKPAEAQDDEMPVDADSQRRAKEWKRQTGGGKPMDYIRWINDKWIEFEKKSKTSAENRSMPRVQEVFDDWLQSLPDKAQAKAAAPQEQVEIPQIGTNAYVRRTRESAVAYVTDYLLNLDEAEGPDIKTTDDAEEIVFDLTDEQAESLVTAVEKAEKSVTVERDHPRYNDQMDAKILKVEALVQSAVEAAYAARRARGVLDMTVSAPVRGEEKSSDPAIADIIGISSGHRYITTGNVVKIHGGEFIEVKWLDGSRKGKIGVVRPSTRIEKVRADRAKAAESPPDQDPEPPKTPGKKLKTAAKKKVEAKAESKPAGVSDKPNFRSVSPAEMGDIVFKGEVTGDQNRFNDFDKRRGEVFFSENMGNQVILQGEELERQAAREAGTTRDGKKRRDRFDVVAARLAELDRMEKARRKDAGEPVGSSKKMLDKKEESEHLALKREAEALRTEHQKSYNKILEALIKRAKQLTYTSYVIETRVLPGGKRYSGQESGMDSDEIGRNPSEVKVSDITAIHLVKNGKVVSVVRFPGEAGTGDRVDQVEEWYATHHRKAPAAQTPGNKLKGAAKAKAAPAQEKAAGDRWTVFDLVIADLTFNEEDMQTRKGPYSELTADAIHRNYDEDDMQPISVWKSPEGELVVLSGHSRIEGFKRRGVKTIPGFIFEGKTFAEAKAIAIKSNFVADQGGYADMVKTLKALVKLKKLNKAETAAEAKSKFKQNAKMVLALMNLKEGGKTFDALMASGSDPETAQKYERIARWIGQLRGEVRSLTDAHELEMFHFLEKNIGKASLNSYAKFAQIIDKSTGMYFEWDTQALNLTHALSMTPSEQAYDDRWKAADRAVKAAEKAYRDREKILLDTVPKYSSEEIRKMLSAEQDAITEAKRDRHEVEKDKAAVDKAGQRERDATLFSVAGAPLSGQRRNAKDIKRGAKNPRLGLGLRRDLAPFHKATPRRDAHVKDDKWVEATDAEMTAAMGSGAVKSLIRIATLLEVDVRFYSGPFTGLEGYYLPKEHSVAIHIGCKSPIGYVLAHELGHALHLGAKEHVEGLVKNVELMDQPAREKMAELMKYYRVNHLKLEIMADVIADQLLNAGGIKHLLDELEPSAARKIRNVILSTLRKLAVKLRLAKASPDHLEALKAIERRLESDFRDVIRFIGRPDQKTMPRGLRANAARDRTVITRRKKRYLHPKWVPESMRRRIEDYDRARHDMTGPHINDNLWQWTQWHVEYLYSGLFNFMHRSGSAIDRAQKERTAAEKKAGLKGAALTKSRIKGSIIDDPLRMMQLRFGWVGLGQSFLFKGITQLDDSSVVINKKGLMQILFDKKYKITKNWSYFNAYLMSKREIAIYEAKEKQARDALIAGASPRSADALRFINPKDGLDRAHIRENYNHVLKAEKEHPSWAEAVVELTQWSDDMLEFVKRTGMLTEERFQAVVNMYSNYVPMHLLSRLDENGHAINTAGRNVKARHVLDGQGKLKEGEFVVPPLESMVNDMFYLIRAAMLNDTARTTARMIDAVSVPTREHANIYGGTWLGNRRMPEMRPVYTSGRNLTSAAGVTRTRVKKAVTPVVMQVFEERYTDAVDAVKYAKDELREARKEYRRATRPRPSKAQIDAATATEMRRLEMARIALRNIKAEIREAVEDVLTTAGLSNSELDVIHDLWVVSSIQEPGVISFMHEGEIVHYEVSEEVFDMFRGQGHSGQDFMVKLFAKMSQIQRIGATSLSPKFPGRNILRDVQQSLITSGHLISLDKGPVQAMSDLIMLGPRLIHAMLSAVGEGTLFDEASRNYAFYSEFMSMDLLGSEKRFLDMAKNDQGRLVYLARNPMAALMLGSTKFEQATRLAVYKKTRDDLMKAGRYTDQEARLMAGLNAREASTDFQRRGSMLPTTGLMWSFLHAGLQGMDIGRRALFSRNVENKRYNWAMAFMTITLQSLLNWLRYRDDEWHKSRERWEKDAFWLWSEDDGKTVMYVPKPHQLGFFFGTLLEHVLDDATKRDPKAMDRIVSNLLQVANPFQITALAPAGVAVMEAQANYSFFRMDNIDKGATEKGLPVFSYTSRTSLWARELGKIFDGAGAPDWLANPKKLDHIARGTFGGVMEWTTAIVDGILRVARPHEYASRPKADKLYGIVTEEWPILNSLMVAGVPSTTRYMQDFADIANRAQRAKTQYDQVMAGRADARAIVYLLEHELVYLAIYDQAATTAGQFAISTGVIKALEMESYNRFSPEMKKKLIDRQNESLHLGARIVVERYYHLEEMGPELIRASLPQAQALDDALRALRKGSK